MAGGREKLSFLLVEDDVEYAEFLRLLVETCYEDATIDSAADVAGALTRLASRPYDICFLDHLLGEETGLDVLRQADATHVPTAFILLTAHAKQDVARQALELGALDYLTKWRFARFEFERSVSYALYRRRKELEFQRSALRDPLTGLGNRELFHEQVRMLAAQARRRTGCFGLLYIDIDGFKDVNDAHGHSVGDELLRQIAARILGRARESDAVSRVGGDEFVVVLSDVRDAEAAAAVARDIEAAIAEPYAVEGIGIVIGASVGCALFPDDATDVEQLTRAADARMYERKKLKPAKPAAAP
ncbi:GGDEF domain-containing response regulator [Shumkonia mesophila]|uniref:GGDEF domain-containing response regulator n=1 Tax=Shumkonia mesophila TaxID=2838854 RepID=UPI0029348FC4|nr:GGDEF domain-containing response regulator [Shumkonia mesophila]